MLLTREPGGSAGAEEIRRLVLEGDPDRWSPEREILLFTAARRDHLEKTILPALARGATVITDRFADSTRIFQGDTRGDLTAMVDRLHDLMLNREPDLTLWFDVAPAIPARRSAAARGPHRFEAQDLPFFERVRAGYAARAAAHPRRFERIDAALTPASVQASMLQTMEARGPW